MFYHEIQLWWHPDFYLKICGWNILSVMSSWNLSSLSLFSTVLSLVIRPQWARLVKCKPLALNIWYCVNNLLNLWALMQHTYLLLSVSAFLWCPHDSTTWDRCTVICWHISVNSCKRSERDKFTVHRCAEALQLKKVWRWMYFNYRLFTGFRAETSQKDWDYFVYLIQFTDNFIF